MHKIERRPFEVPSPPSPTSRDDDPMKGIVIGTAGSILLWAAIIWAFRTCA